MTESLKKIVNQSLSQFPKNKLSQSIHDFGTDAVNKSFELNSQSDDSMSNDELLQMEIKQLKRENAFLKGKIQQMKKGNLFHKPQLIKRQSLNCTNILKKKPDQKQLSNQNSVNFILRQIQSILKSLASVHKLRTEDKVWAIEQQSQNRQNLEQLNFMKHDKEYRQKLNKKLEMIPLAKQETRYGSLLQIFSEFYHKKLEEQKRMKDKIEKYIQKTIEISRRLIENANNKAYEKSLKSSCIYSSNPLHSDTSITLNHTLSSKDISLLCQVPKKIYLPEKHQLSYSTMDAQYVQRQID